MLVNPIIINERYQVIDGQHRLEAAKAAKVAIYYLLIPGYNLDHVHALNANQKNWTNREFMEGYASKGLKSYAQLKEFKKRHNCFTLSDCIALCSNLTSSGSFSKTTDNRHSSNFKSPREVFRDGTWKTRNMKQAEDEAIKIKQIEPFFRDGYNSATFVGTILWLFHEKGDIFNFESFLKKLKIQPKALEKTSTREQCKALIEDIYNFKRRVKVNLRF